MTLEVNTLVLIGSILGGLKIAWLYSLSYDRGGRASRRSQVKSSALHLGHVWDRSSFNTNVIFSLISSSFAMFLSSFPSLLMFTSRRILREIHLLQLHLRSLQSALRGYRLVRLIYSKGTRVPRRAL